MNNKTQALSLKTIKEQVSPVGAGLGAWVRHMCTLAAGGVFSEFSSWGKRGMTWE